MDFLNKINHVMIADILKDVFQTESRGVPMPDKPMIAKATVVQKVKPITIHSLLVIALLI